ncbi:MAG: uroporphyrinogen decarboxylase family protein [Sedimentisphaerales bacterium]|jgi:MtaA/CmuA family methyltransferase
MTGRQRVFAMFGGRQVDHLPCMPITMQFAADRIGRRYHDYATDYRVLVEGQLRVAEEFGFDHVGCISDPTREATDCGAAIVFHDDAPPCIDERNSLLADKGRLAKLKMPDVLGGGRMHDRVKAAAMFKEKARKDKIIEGWIEGPCAEGADLRGISTIMTDFYEDAGFVNGLFEFVTELGLKFAKSQIEAGVDLMGIGDAAASLVGPKIYEEFVWPYEKRLVDGIHKLGAAVRLHICGNTRGILEGMGRLGAEMIDLDYPCPISLAREKMGQKQVICGNINPVSVLRDGSPQDIYRAVEACHKEAGVNFVVGAGCEITRDTPIDNVKMLGHYASSH